MPKNLLLLGAGASYGSDDPTITPPLGGISLFNSLTEFDPVGWGKLPEEQAAIFQDDFEKGMVDILNGKSGNELRLQRAMAAFFFNFQPRNTNLYFDLAKKIKQLKWEGVIATLNYEHLLTVALTETGNHPFFRNKGLIQQDGIEICFPHGTCNIFCTAVKAHPTSVFINCEVDGPIKYVTAPEDFKKEIENNAIPPVMSYFVPSKDTMSGVSFIKNQRKRLEELIIAAERIGIIGIKVRTHDQHIWGPLSKTDAQITYCSGESAGKDFESWSKQNRTGKLYRIIPKYFRQGFSEICSALNL
jgi:hypothetical protein